MKKILAHGLIIVFLLLISRNAGADWEKTYGGTGEDWGMSVQQTADGGYILVGEKDIYGSTDGDVWLIKTDASGNKQWDKTFGGADIDEADCVRQTADGGYIIAGTTFSYGAGGSDAWLIKTDGNGNKLWDRTYGTTGWEFAYCVQQTADLGYIIAGATENEVWLIKTYSNGNKEWDKTFSRACGDWGESVQQTDDGGYIIGAGSWSCSYITDVWLIKTDSSGVLERDAVFSNGTDEDFDVCVQQTPDHGYILTSQKRSSNGDDDVLLIKTDSNLNELWSHTFGELSNEEAGISLDQTSDGGFIITGITFSWSTFDQDILLIKTDANGNKSWDMTLGGSDFEVGRSVQQTADGAYIVCGVTSSYGAGEGDVWLIKTFGSGSSQTTSITSIAAHDGTVRESTGTSNVGGANNSIASISTALRMGDDYGTFAQGERQLKAIVSFDTSSIPDAATILSAKLTVTGGGVVGRNPLSTHGPCYVDIREGYFGSSLSLENADFEAAATATRVATMPAPPAGSRVSTGTLNAAGLAAINKQGYTQMRLYFSLDDNNDYNDDYVGCYSGESAIIANRPTLEVTYQE